MKTITIIIPAYNEEKALLILVRDLIKTLKANSISWNIIIVNDASTDGTLEHANQLSGEFPEVSVINNSENLNLGKSYQKALEKINTDFVSWIPADGEIPPSIFSEILPLMDLNSIVITYPTNSYKARSFARFLLSKLYRTAVNTLFGLRVEYQNGTSIIGVKYLKERSLISEGFTINLEILLRAKRNGLQIHQAPFELKEREFGESSAISIKKIFFLIVTLVKLLKS